MLRKGDSFGARVLSLVIDEQPTDRIEDEEINNDQTTFTAEIL